MHERESIDDKRGDRFFYLPKNIASAMNYGTPFQVTRGCGLAASIERLKAAGKIKYSKRAGGFVVVKEE